LTSEEGAIRRKKQCCEREDEGREKGGRGMKMTEMEKKGH